MGIAGHVSVAVEGWGAASDPKSIFWYDAGHGLNQRAVLDRAEWLRGQIGIGPLDLEDRKRLETKGQ